MQAAVYLAQGQTNSTIDASSCNDFLGFKQSVDCVNNVPISSTRQLGKSAVHDLQRRLEKLEATVHQSSDSPSNKCAVVAPWLQAASFEQTPSLFSLGGVSWHQVPDPSLSSAQPGH